MDFYILASIGCVSWCVWRLVGMNFVLVCPVDSFPALAVVIRAIHGVRQCLIPEWAQGACVCVCVCVCVLSLLWVVCCSCCCVCCFCWCGGRSVGWGS